MSLTAEEFANGTLKLILSKNFSFTAQTVPDPTKDLSIHPRSNTISTSQYVGDTCQAKEKGQGQVRPKSSGEQFFTATINTPSPFLTSFTPLDRSLSLARAPQTLAPPLLHVAGEEELHCLDLVAVVLAPVADFFTPPPP